MGSSQVMHIDYTVHIANSLIQSKVPEGSFLKSVSTLIRGSFLLHDVIILCTLHVTQLLHDVTNGGKSPKQKPSFPCFQDEFLQAFDSSALTHIDRSDSLPFTIISIISSPCPVSFKLVAKAHGK